MNRRTYACVGMTIIEKRRGVVLLEAIVALTILITAGLWTVVMARQAAQTVMRSRDADQEMARASTFFDAVSLWPREDLDRHLGDRYEGAWILHIDRPTTTLYAITLRTVPDNTKGGHGGRVLLQTMLYRAEESRAVP